MTGGPLPGSSQLGSAFVYTRILIKINEQIDGKDIDFGFKYLFKESYETNKHSLYGYDNEQINHINRSLIKNKMIHNSVHYSCKLFFIGILFIRFNITVNNKK